MVFLSENGSHTFLAYNAWRQHCADENIQDPWELERSIQDEYTDYGNKIIGGREIYTINVKEPTEDQIQRLKDCYKYRKDYMRDRDIWTGNYLLKNYGYNDLTIFAQAHSRDNPAFQEWFSNIKPCEGIDGQCAFICPIFQTCPYKMQGQFQSGVEV